MNERVTIESIDDLCFDSGLYDLILYPTAKKALDLHADKVKKSIPFNCEIDGYKVEMIQNNVINEELFPFMFPQFQDAEKMININVEIKGRIYVGAIYYLIKGKWVKDES